MKRKILITLFFILIIPSVHACSNPLIYNEYGVPINLYGIGFLAIDGNDYPIEQPEILYNFTVSNTNSQNLTFSLTPSDDLLGYLYGGTFKLGPNEFTQISLTVYVDGSSKFGVIRIAGICEDGLPMPEGEFNLRIYGRGNNDPQFCGNTKDSCGKWPDCVDLTGRDGCYDGYNREYYCGGNEVRYVESCSNYCCRSYYGEEAYCSHGICFGTTPVCEDECSFSGMECHDEDIYTCVWQEDGCYDLVLSEDCGELTCVDAECVDESVFRGKIAYLCQDNSCFEGIEPDLIPWLKARGWKVDAKAYDAWTNTELDHYDLMVCSDELKACKLTGPSYNEHTLQNRSLLEVADYRNLQGAYNLGYVKNPYGSLRQSNLLYITDTDDLVMKIFPIETPIFSYSTKMTIAADYNIEPSVIDLADVGYDGGKSTLFKVETEGTHGRYAYVGWFYKLLPDDLTDDGGELLDRIILWTICGDECFFDPNENQPPVAISKLTPNPIGYEGQQIKFDGSESYDPEGQNLTYYWDFGNGENSGWIIEEITYHTYDTQGEYIVKLIVNDGELDSEPDIKILTILPTIKNKVAFICGDNICSDESEQTLISFLTDNGYYVEGKTQNSWKSNDLQGFDFMICSDAAKGCGIKSWTDVYDRHKNGMMGFLEIPDYKYVRAGYKFGYTNSLMGYSSTGSDIIVVGEDPITSGLSGNIYNSDNIIAGVFSSYLKPSTVNLANLDYRKETSVLFKIDPEDNHGRYAYLGWFYRSSISDLTEDGEEMLLRTITWVQCGSVEGC